MTSLYEDPVVRFGRREAAFALAMWLIAMTVTVATCYRYGYQRSLEDVTYVLWFPDLIFWVLICPWLACIAVSTVFAVCFMHDAPLEVESAGTADAPEAGRA